MLPQLRPQMARQTSDMRSLPAPFATLISEYWRQAPPKVLLQEIRRRIAEPGAEAAVVKAISHERLEFKNLWNHSLPINQLPYEILLQVFAFASTHFEIAPTRWPDSRFWTLMAVCRHWRDLIVGTQAIWCTIDPRKNVDWTELCLSRSAAISINLLARVRNPHHLDRLKIMYPHVNRIRSLIFNVNERWYPYGDTKPDPFAALQPLFGNGMPMLEELDFAATNRPRGSISGFLVDTELISKRFPRLRSLTLVGVVAPQDPSLYTHLRTLSLRTCSHALSFDHFLDATDSCTRLKDLLLEDTLHHLSGDWIYGDPSPRRSLISFAHLDRLVVHAHSAICTSRFLAHLHIHPYTSLDISADAEDGEDSGAGALDGAQSMAAMLPRNPAVTLEPLATANALLMFMSLSANSPKISTDPTYSTPSEQPTVHLRMQLGPRDPANPYMSSRWGSVRNLAELLGPSPLRSLSISEVHPDTVASWATVFRTFHLLERLSISGGGCETTWAVGIKNVFLGLHAASTTDPDSPVACPNLAHVKVRAYGVDITSVYQPMRTCFRFRGDRQVVLAQLELDFMACTSSTALRRACVKDIVGCVERLNLRGVCLDESEENLREPAETGLGRSQGDEPGATVANAGMHSGRVLEVFEGPVNQPFKSLRRLLKKFRRRKGNGSVV